MIKLVAFDWNGTLLSDTYAICEGVNEVLKIFNMNPITLPVYQKHFDVPVKKAYLGFGVSESDFDQNSTLVAQTFYPYYEEKISRARTRPNTRRTLDWLYERGITSLIVSNHIDEYIIKHVKRLKIEKYFSVFLANSHGETVHHGRNKGDKLKTYLQNNDIFPNETIIVGDTVEEIEIGKELGIISVAITNGACSISRLKAAKPDYLINNLKELITIIQDSNQAESNVTILNILSFQ